ncbi:chemotaxis protein CheW [Roseofilum sp. BLCC_M154]|uniref:Chemotaxis protein CheW n=1 Tax=Roseofilum acuticapitatum BLCC-M154 TaxID=3022444 RepID=A0ABT7AMH7_9CYAN|nr:chemotaxis protein CheW [Roseofilum acuticapitatum]MDJ1168102.1 chemotaxis protein CheW [Roseofilum acuticapitatum BLCC-M154]
MINPSPTHGQTTLPFILFELAGTTYGILSHQVQQIEMIDKITPVPNALPFVEGVVFCRSQVIPALNLRTRLGFEKKNYDLLTRLIVIQIQTNQTEESDRRVGLIVDSAREFIAIPQTLIGPPPEGLSNTPSQYLSSIITLENRVILILDLEKIIET